MNPRAARGAALIAAMLVAAIIASIAVALTSRDQFSVLAVARLRDTATADELLHSLEVQAVRVLSKDLEDSRLDSSDEPWATTEFAAERGEMTALAHLVDAQRLFNLNAMAFRPPDADDADADDDVPPAVDDEAAAELGANQNSAAARAFADVVPGVREAVPVPSKDGAGDKTQAPAGEAAADEETLSEQQVAVVRFHLLLQALGLPEDFVPAVLDWLDTDNDTRFPNGAEDEYYTRLDVPYRAANGPLADRSELLLIRGITPEIYEKLAPHVTVLEPAAGLNVNTAPAEVLMSLGPGIDRATADVFVSSRTVQPFADVASVLRHPLFVGRPIIEKGLVTSSEVFELRASVTTGQLTNHLRSQIARESPNQLRVVRRERRYADD